MRRSVTFIVGVEVKAIYLPISFQELQAFRKFKNDVINDEEAEILLALDNIYLKSVNK